MRDAGNESTRPRRKKSLGQHFLNSGRIINRIVAAADPGEDSTVLEIGPGRGALTRELAGRAGRLVLVEMDHELVLVLQDFFPDAEVIEADATKLELTDQFFVDEKVIAVGNLPYNAGGRILFNLLMSDVSFVRLVFMFQKEVALRFSALPGERNFGAASLLLSLLSDVHYLFDVAPSKFVPPPRVTSGVVCFVPRVPEPGTEFVHTPEFFTFVHDIFAQPRKTVANSMMNGLSIGREQAEKLLEGAGTDPGIRPQKITPADAVAMYKSFQKR